MLKAQIQGNLVFEPEIKELRASGEKEEHKRKVPRNFILPDGLFNI